MLYDGNLPLSAAHQQALGGNEHAPDVHLHGPFVERHTADAKGMLYDGNLPLSAVHQQALVGNKHVPDGDEQPPVQRMYCADKQQQLPD